MTNTFKISTIVKSGLAALVLASAASSFVEVSTAEAAVAPALQKYCSQYHRGSFVNQYRHNGTPICTLKNHYSMRHFRINIGHACRMAGGTGAFQKVAFGRYSCTTRVNRNNNRYNTTRYNRRVARVGGWVKPNIQGYCSRYHRGSFANTMRANGAPICTLKNHYSMMHYRVNLNTACRLAGGNGRYQQVAYGNYRCNR